MNWVYRSDQTLPAYTVTWSDGDGEVINFSSGDYSFTLELADVTTGTVALTKTTNIVGAAMSPNISVAWAIGDLDLTPSTYRIHLAATRDSFPRVFNPGNPDTITIVAAPS